MLLFVPGWSMPGSVWERQVEGLKRSFRVTVLDPRGQGKSDKTEKSQFTERRAADTKEFIARLGLRDITLVGWSMAVGEVLSYVDQFSDDALRAIVLVDGVVRNAPEMWPEGFAFARGYLRNRLEWTEAFVQIATTPSTPPAFRARLVDSCTSMPAASAYGLLLDYLFTDNSQLVMKCSRPLLYVSQPAMGGQGEMIRQLVPHARVECFADSGHTLFYDQADRFNALLAEFVTAAAAAPP